MSNLITFCSHTARVVGLLVLAGLLATPTDAQLRSPSDFLGYELGSRFTPHHLVTRYVQHVADESPNVMAEEYGQTYEGRPLLLAYVAEPSNLDRLDQIRLDNLARAGMEDGPVRRELDNSVVVWLSYNVHGNESVSTEAAMQTLYELADTANTRTQAWLENTVVIIDPCINPDGRERYVQWYNRTAGAFVNPNEDDWTHDEPWPGGRTNHYFFDLNRDWAWASQTETRQRLARYNAWLPHVHVDFHEQGINQPYYFAPAAEPYHELITDWQRELQTEIGRNNARYFDRHGWLYFTKQRFDLFYPGYGDTWPTYNGAVGMTYEQGGSSRAGLAVETQEGDTLTLGDRIAHHHTTGLSTIEVASQNAPRILDEFAAYFQNDEVRASFVVRSSEHPERAIAMRELLDLQGIDYRVLSESGTIDGVDYVSGEEGRQEIRRGDVLVPGDQPKSALARILFERDAALADSVTYDITAWSLPFLYGLNAFSTNAPVRVSTQAAGVLRADVPAVVPSGIEHPYAYVAPFASIRDHRFLASLHANNVTVRMAHEPFAVAGREFERGTLVITRAGNAQLGDRFDAKVRDLAEKHERTLFAVRTGFVDAGPDLGSSDVTFLKPPRVAVVGGDAVSSGSMGEIWHYFDERVRYPVTIVNGDALRGIALDDYDVLVLPSGSYQSVLTGQNLERVVAWVRGGGKVIAVGGAARFLAGKDGFGLALLDRSDRDADADSTNKEPAARLYADRERRNISGGIPGAFFLVTVDNTHPAGYGLDRTLPWLRSGSAAAGPLARGWNVGIVKSGKPVSGFAGHRTEESVDGSLAIGVEDLGRGTVVYLMDDPLFRGMSYTGALVFGNAVFAVGTD